MEQRLRNVENVINMRAGMAGAGNHTGRFGSQQQQRFIRPGRPDMSHVNGQQNQRYFFQAILKRKRMK